MEQREILIVDSSANRKIVVNTNATTFGELKVAARAAGINFEGKSWLEGLTKTEPTSDDSILPTNVPYVPKEGPNAGRQITTNNLVYMITNTNKRIKSGMSRQEVYTEIRKYNLSNAIKERFGRNFTQVSTNVLISFIDCAKACDKKANTIKKPAPLCSANVTSERAIVSALADFLNALPTDIVNKAAKLAESRETQRVDFSGMSIEELKRQFG